MYVGKVCELYGSHSGLNSQKSALFPLAHYLPLINSPEDACMRFEALLHAVNDLKADILSLAIAIQPQDQDIRPFALRSQVVRNEFAGWLFACWSTK